MDELDFLDTLIAAQSKNPQNAAIFNMAMEKAGGLFEDPNKNRQNQLIDMLTQAQMGRFAETGDADALNMIGKLFDSEDPLETLKNYQPTGTAGLMKRTQQQFDTDIQPFMEDALDGGDSETADILSQFTPGALEQLKTKKTDISDRAKEEAMFRENQSSSGDLGARLNIALRGITPGRYETLQGFKPSASDKSRVLKEEVRNIYNNLGQ
jgi:hypothetical protein